MGKSKKKSAHFAIYILAFMAFVFISIGGAFSYFSYDFSNYAIATTGTVVNVEASYSDGSTTYKPTIAYVDYNGDKRSGQTFLSSSTYNFSRGSMVDILYDTRDTQSLRMDSWFALWGFGLIFLITGLVLAGIALVIKRASGKSRRGSSASRSRQPESTSAAKYSYSSNSADDFESEEDHRRETEYKPTVRRQ